MKIRIVIADSADLTRIGMRAILETRLDFVVEASVASTADLLEASRRRPPVIIVDERLDPDLDVLTVVEKVGQAAPFARRLVCGQLTDGLLIRDLFAMGVYGYLYKGDELQLSLITAVETAMRNRLYLSPTANAEYLIAMQSPERDWRLDREARAVLRLLAQGCHVGQIALALHIAPRRVYWVRQKLRQRFGAVTNEHMISRAAAEGFVYPS